MSKDIYRCPGIITGLGYVVGGGYSGITKDLDEAVKTAAELLRDHFDCEVVIRFNSDRRSGGAWVRESEKDTLGTNDSIGLGAHLYNREFASLPISVRMSMSQAEWNRCRNNPDAIWFETAINIKKTINSVPENSNRLNYTGEYEFRDWDTLEDAAEYLFSHVSGIRES